MGIPAETASFVPRMVLLLVVLLALDGCSTLPSVTRIEYRTELASSKGREPATIVFTVGAGSRQHTTTEAVTLGEIAVPEIHQVIGPAEMESLVSGLDDAGFFSLPTSQAGDGSDERVITVHLEGAAPYKVKKADLREGDPGRLQAFSRAERLLIQATQGGEHYEPARRH